MALLHILLLWLLKCSMCVITGNLRVGVCLIGTVGNLELSSKIKYILSRNNTAREQTVYDMVVVSPKVYVPRKNTKADELAVNRTKNFNEKAMREQLAGHVGNLVVNYVDVKHREIVINRGIHGLDMGAKDLKVKDRNIQWNVLLFFELSSCYDSFLDMEISVGVKYDVFITLQGSSTILSAVDPREMPLAVDGVVQKDVVVQPICGVKDGEVDDVWGAILTRNAGYDFFTAPIDHYYLFSDVMMKKEDQKVAERVPGNERSLAPSVKADSKESRAHRNRVLNRGKHTISVRKFLKKAYMSKKFAYIQNC